MATRPIPPLLCRRPLGGTLCLNTLSHATVVTLSTVRGTFPCAACLDKINVGISFICPLPSGKLPIRRKTTLLTATNARLPAVL